MKANLAGNWPVKRRSQIFLFQGLRSTRSLTKRLGEPREFEGAKKKSFFFLFRARDDLTTLLMSSGVTRRKQQAPPADRQGLELVKLLFPELLFSVALSNNCVFIPPVATALGVLAQHKGQKSLLMARFSATAVGHKGKNEFPKKTALQSVADRWLGE